MTCSRLDLPAQETFVAWLDRQIHRQDDVGAFARYAAKDKVFPRTRWQLFYFLARYEGMPEQRAGVKLAHREWRQTKKNATAQVNATIPPSGAAR